MPQLCSCKQRHSGAIRVAGLGIGSRLVRHAALATMELLPAAQHVQFVACRRHCCHWRRDSLGASPWAGGLFFLDFSAYARFIIAIVMFVVMERGAEERIAGILRDGRRQRGRANYRDHILLN